MNTVGTGTTAAFANLVTPFSPVGKQAVGLENAEAKEEVLAPVEEPTKSAEAFNRSNEESEIQQLLRTQDDSESVSNESNTSLQTDEQASEEGAASDDERKAQQEQERLDQQQIRELAARDREVRAHEQAHAAVGGQFAGSPSFSFQRGPDGVNYAVGGEVPISLPSGGDPQTTLRAAEQVRQAALAPADPSAQDQRIAAQASQLAIDTRAEIVALENEQRQAETKASQAEQAQQQEDEEKRLQAQQDEIEERRQQQLLAENRRRAVQLSDQLTAVDSIDNEQVVGSFFDQQA